MHRFAHRLAGFVVGASALWLGGFLVVKGESPRGSSVPILIALFFVGGVAWWFTRSSDDGPGRDAPAEQRVGDVLAGTGGAAPVAQGSGAASAGGPAISQPQVSGDLQIGDRNYVLPEASQSVVSGTSWSGALADAVTELDQNRKVFRRVQETKHLPRAPARKAYSGLADQFADKGMWKSRQVLDEAYGVCDEVWARYRELPRFEGPMADPIVPVVDDSVPLSHAIAVLTDAVVHLREIQEGAHEWPRLSIGRARIPRESRVIESEGFALAFYRPGRVIQIPITNDQGSPKAEAVHAELRFMPDDRDGSFSPRDPVRAEWVTDGEGLVTRIDLPGNGQAHLLNVAVVFDSGYPCIFEWTRASRQAKLNGHEVWSNAVEIEISVSDSSPAPPVTDKLKIEVRGSMILADLASEVGGDRGTNWVSVEGKGWEWT